MPQNAEGGADQGKLVLIFSYLSNYDGVKCIILIMVVYLRKIIWKRMFLCVNVEFLKLNEFNRMLGRGGFQC